ncbi:MAG: hypothetical protein P1V34_11245 [Alphaproteobacteria bacterium]|nr:hypothetical protein [Alphaproteobacteria bacterium]
MDIDFSANMYSDPAMRPHLKKLYDSQYAAFYERIDAMPKTPSTVSMKMPDGQAVEAHEISAEQYRAAVPSFDKWLELQSRMLNDGNLPGSMQSIETARQHLQILEQNSPNSSSGVQTVFSNGNKILGYINVDGSLATHSGGSVLQDIARKADEMGLTGEAKITYLQEQGKKALSEQYSNLRVTQYDASNRPNKTEFARSWYGDHDVNESYQSALANAIAHLAEMETLHQQQMDRRNEMQAFLLQSMQEMQSGQTVYAQEENPLMTPIQSAA